MYCDGCDILACVCCCPVARWRQVRWPRPAICYTNQGWIFTKCLQIHLRGKYFTIFSSMVNTAVPSVDLKIWREKDIKPNHWKIKLSRINELNVIYLPPASHVLFSVPPLLLTADCSAVSGHKLEQLTANGPHLHHPHIILPCSLPACWHIHLLCHLIFDFVLFVPLVHTSTDNIEIMCRICCLKCWKVIALAQHNLNYATLNESIDFSELWNSYLIKID